MFILFKNARFEAIYYELFRKLIKNLIKKKNIDTPYKTYWIFIRLNTPLTKKSKNSRMGKGKGALYRWLCRLPKGYKLMEFKNLNALRLSNIARKWTKRINLPIIFHSKINL